MEDRINGIPVYAITLGDNPDAGLEFISFVDEPAIMEMGLAFNRDEEVYKFATNVDKQVVAGPTMIPDVPLYRRDADGEFYVVFSKEVIEQLVDKFNKSSKEFKINVDHKDVVTSAFIKSNWIIEDTEHDKSRMYGFNNLPIGTHFMEVKVDDKEFWDNQIKANGKFGFSVEGLFGLELLREQFNANNKNDKNENKMELTPEEIKMITDLRLAAESAPEDSPEIESPASGSTEPAPEVIVEVEAEDMPAEEPAPAEAPAEEAAPAMDEAMVAEMIQAKYDELLSMIAELKSMIEAPSEDAPVEVAMSKHDGQLGFLKALQSKVG
jgi:hypothetical protein